MENGENIPKDYGMSAVNDFKFNEPVVDAVVNIALAQRGKILNSELELRVICFAVKTLLADNLHEMGGYFGSMKTDDLNDICGDFCKDKDINGNCDCILIYHSTIDNWVRKFGFNDLYDDCFRIGSGSGMKKEKISFNYDNEEHILWLWMGDYWNMGVGAEIGLYRYSHTMYYLDPFSITRHYDAIEYELPMTLYLYEESGGGYENIFCWEPIDQWWITGFVPSRQNANPKNMVTIGTVNFTVDSNQVLRDKMYDALKHAMLDNPLSQYLIFDDDDNTVWVCWY